MRRQSPKDPGYPLQGRATPKGTIFQIVRGANRFRSNDRADIQRWEQILGQGGSTTPRTRPVNAKELMCVLEVKMKTIEPPADSVRARQWLRDKEKPQQRMSGAVSLGEMGDIEDLPRLRVLLSDPLDVVCASAIQGISRLWERHAPTEQGEVLLAALLHGDVAVRDLARECLLGHGWIREWIRCAEGQEQTRRANFCQHTVQSLLRTHRLSKQEKHTYLQKFREEGEPVTTCICRALQQEIHHQERALAVSQEAAQILARDPSGNMGLQLQLHQIRGQQHFLTFLRSILEEYNTGLSAPKTPQ